MTSHENPPKPEGVMLPVPKLTPEQAERLRVRIADFYGITPDQISTESLSEKILTLSDQSVADQVSQFMEEVQRPVADPEPVPDPVPELILPPLPADVPLPADIPTPPEAVPAPAPVPIVPLDPVPSPLPVLPEAVPEKKASLFSRMVSSVGETLSGIGAELRQDIVIAVCHDQHLWLNNKFLSWKQEATRQISEHIAESEAEIKKITTSKEERAKTTAAVKAKLGSLDLADLTRIAKEDKKDQEEIDRLQKKANELIILKDRTVTELKRYEETRRQLTVEVVEMLEKRLEPYYKSLEKLKLEKGVFETMITSFTEQKGEIEKEVSLLEQTLKDNPLLKNSLTAQINKLRDQISVGEDMIARKKMQIQSSIEPAFAQLTYKARMIINRIDIYESLGKGEPVKKVDYLPETEAKKPKPGSAPSPEAKVEKDLTPRFELTNFVRVWNNFHGSELTLNEADFADFVKLKKDEKLSFNELEQNLILWCADLARKGKKTLTGDRVKFLNSFTRASLKPIK